LTRQAPQEAEQKLNAANTASGKRTALNNTMEYWGKLEILIR
jgi:hypothetical protein